MFVYARPLTHASGAIAIVLNLTLILGACSASTSEPEATLTPESTGNATISDATQTDAALSTGSRCANNQRSNVSQGLHNRLGEFLFTS